jgi:hypothetical protein
LEFDGFFSNYRFTKGQALYDGNFYPPTSALTATSQGATGSNVKLLCCQYNSSATAATIIPTGSIGTSGSPTATNFNAFTTDPNTVRGQSGVYCVLDRNTVNAGTLDEAALVYAGPGGWRRCYGNMGFSTGKWYYEVTMVGTVAGQSSGNDHNGFGWGEKSEPGDTTSPNSTTNVLFYQETGWYKNFGSSKSNSSQVINQGDVLSVAVDLDANTFVFRRNNVSVVSGTIGGTAGRELFPFIFSYDHQYGEMHCNFGQKAFRFPPPEGYQPLTSTAARPDAVIARADKVVSAAPYASTAADNLSIDVGFKPDLSLFSIRNQTGYIKYIFDSPRGATKYLAISHTQTTNAEGTGADTLKSFDSNGVTIGTNGQMNGSTSHTFVCWNWKAGGGKVGGGGFFKDDIEYASAAAVGLTGGDITPSACSIGTKQGFSIIGYTGIDNGSARTIPHGLSQKPDFMLVKQRTDSSTSWIIYHSGLGATKYFQFDATGAGTNAGPWGNTEPTSSLFTVGSSYNNTNRVSRNYISYHWHNVPGLQKFGTYVGNGDADGPHIDLGFRPAIVIIRLNGNDDWRIYDNKRGVFNLNDVRLLLNSNASENNLAGLDFTSNGFKLKTNSTSANGDGSTYVYAAWAEAPQFNMFGATSNAV